MPQRFLRNPPCAAHDILLQERVPRNVCSGVVGQRFVRLTLEQRSLAPGGGGYFSCVRPNVGRRTMALSGAAPCLAPSARAKNT